jgi:hypothetical protein
MNEITNFVERPSLGSSLLSVIGKAAADPRVDIDKMTALLEMQERIVARDALAQFNLAMAIVNQHDLRVGRAGTASLGGKGSYRFARWEDMDEVIRPLLRSAGMWLSFDSKREPDGGMTINGTLSHEAGHSASASIYLPVDTGPGRNPLQQMGSTISYGKRYTAEMLLNIVREDEDDDGRAGGAYRAERPAARAQEPARELPFVERAEAALNAEANGTKWLSLLGRILEAAETIEHVSRIRTLPNVIEGSKKAPTAVRSIIAEFFTKAVDRLSPTEAPGHTDLMVPPESLDAFMDANPLPAGSDLLADIRREIADMDKLAVLEAWAEGAGRMALNAIKEHSPQAWQEAVSEIDTRRIELGG